MPNIKGIQVFEEADVINMFAFSGDFPVNKGTFVKIVSGWTTEQNLQMIGNPGLQVNNTVSQRYGVAAKIAACSASGDAAVGMLIYGGAEVDENGEKLIYNPRKAVELEVFLTGQAAPFVTRGTFLYSGIAGNPTAGADAYLGTDGGLNVSGSATATATKVGKFLGPKDANGFALFRLTL